MDLRAGDSRAVVDVARGGAVVSLRLAGIEWLDPPREDRAVTGEDFAESGFGGWAECLPSIAPSVAVVGGRELPVADHGGAWSRPWRVLALRRGLLATYVAIADVGLELTRVAQLRPGGLRLAYELRAEEPVAVVWAGHGLFAPAPDLALGGLGPAARTTFRSRDDVEPWAPGPDGVRRWADAPAATAVKWFAPWPSGGVVLRRGDVTLTVDAERDDGGPLFAGIWQNRAGHPVDAPREHLGVEPTIGDADDLREAAARGTAASVGPDAPLRWWVSLEARRRGGPSSSGFVAEPAGEVGTPEERHTVTPCPAS